MDHVKTFVQKPPLSQVLYKYHRENEERPFMTDVDVYCDGGYIPVHSWVIMAASPLFKDHIMSLSKSEREHMIVHLPDYNIEHVTPVINLLYTGQCLIKRKDISIVWEILDNLKITNSEVCSSPATPNDVRNKSYIRRYLLDSDDDESFSAEEDENAQLLRPKVPIINNQTEDMKLRLPLVPPHAPEHFPVPPTISTPVQINTHEQQQQQPSTSHANFSQVIIPPRQQQQQQLQQQQPLQEQRQQQKIQEQQRLLLLQAQQIQQQQKLQQQERQPEQSQPQQLQQEQIPPQQLQQKQIQPQQLQQEQTQQQRASISNAVTLTQSPSTICTPSSSKGPSLPPNTPQQPSVKQYEKRKSKFIEVIRDGSGIKVAKKASEDQNDDGKQDNDNTESGSITGVIRSEAENNEVESSFENRDDSVSTRTTSPATVIDQAINGPQVENVDKAEDVISGKRKTTTSSVSHNEEEERKRRKIISHESETDEIDDEDSDDSDSNSFDMDLDVGLVSDEEVTLHECRVVLEKLAKSDDDAYQEKLVTLLADLQKRIQEKQRQQTNLNSTTNINVNDNENILAQSIPSSSSTTTTITTKVVGGQQKQTPVSQDTLQHSSSSDSSLNASTEMENSGPNNSMNDGNDSDVTTIVSPVAPMDLSSRNFSKDNEKSNSTKVIQTPTPTSTTASSPILPSHNIAENSTNEPTEIPTTPTLPVSPTSCTQSTPPINTISSPINNAEKSVQNTESIRIPPPSNITVNSIRNINVRENNSNSSRSPIPFSRVLPTTSTAATNSISTTTATGQNDTESIAETQQSVSVTSSTVLPQVTTQAPPRQQESSPLVTEHPPEEAPLDAAAAQAEEERKREEINLMRRMRRNRQFQPQQQQQQHQEGIQAIPTVTPSSTIAPTNNVFVQPSKPASMSLPGTENSIRIERVVSGLAATQLAATTNSNPVPNQLPNNSNSNIPSRPAISPQITTNITAPPTNSSININNNLSAINTNVVGASSVRLNPTLISQRQQQHQQQSSTTALIIPSQPIQSVHVNPNNVHPRVPPATASGSIQVPYVSVPGGGGAGSGGENRASISLVSADSNNNNLTNANGIVADSNPTFLARTIYDGFPIRVYRRPQLSVTPHSVNPNPSSSATVSSLTVSAASHVNSYSSSSNNNTNVLSNGNNVGSNIMTARPSPITISRVSSSTQGLQQVEPVQTPRQVEENVRPTPANNIAAVVNNLHNLQQQQLRASAQNINSTSTANISIHQNTNIVIQQQEPAAINSIIHQLNANLIQTPQPPQQQQQQQPSQQRPAARSSGRIVCTDCAEVFSAESYPDHLCFGQD